jgi:hypothetical protein
MVTRLSTPGGLDRFVRLATVGDVATARICAALLETEGIDVRLHGEALGPYPMTIGRFAETELWVPESRVVDGRRIMLEAEVDAVLGAAEAPEEPAAHAWVYWVAGLSIGAVIVGRVLIYVF